MYVLQITYICIHIVFNTCKYLRGTSRRAPLHTTDKATSSDQNLSYVEYIQSACSTGVLFGYSALAAALIRRGEYSNLCDAAASGEAASAGTDAGDMALEGLGDTHMGNISYIRMYIYKYIHTYIYLCV